MRRTYAKNAPHHLNIIRRFSLSDFGTIRALQATLKTASKYDIIRMGTPKNGVPIRVNWNRLIMKIKRIHA